MSQLGRIGGQVLTDNLLRAGVDLAFETNLLYLDVNNRRIGIKRSVPVYDLDVNNTILTDNLTVTNQATISGIRFAAPNTITSTVAPIDVFINGSMLFHDRLTTNNLEFDDNFIGSFSNSNIIFDPSGNGTVELFSTTNITGNLDVDGNISLPGDLRSDGNITFGDSTINNSDTVSIAPDLTQSIIPGNNILYDLGTSTRRWRSGFFQNAEVTTGFTAGNITVAAPSSISVPTGNLSINISGSDPVANFSSDLQTSGLRFDGNTIQSFTNQNIRFDPNAGGPINLEATTNVTGNLRVSGNTAMIGDLSLQGTITIGDQTIDTVTIAPDFTQSIIPGDDLIYALGADASDSSPRRWAEIHSPDWTNISIPDSWNGSGLRPQAVTIVDQMRLNGVANTIFATQSNDDILINPDTGLTFIEKTSWQNNDLTNLLNTPLTFSSTGIGYYNFNGTNAMVVPSGDNSERRVTPEVGETRWNTEVGYLECFDGNVWVISTGGGEEVTQQIMDDLGNVYVLILG